VPQVAQPDPRKRSRSKFPKEASAGWKVFGEPRSGARRGDAGKGLNFSLTAFNVENDPVDQLTANDDFRPARGPMAEQRAPRPRRRPQRSALAVGVGFSQGSDALYDCLAVRRAVDCRRAEETHALARATSPGDFFQLEPDKQIAGLTGLGVPGHKDCHEVAGGQALQGFTGLDSTATSGSNSARAARMAYPAAQRVGGEAGGYSPAYRREAIIVASSISSSCFPLSLRTEAKDLPGPQLIAGASGENARALATVPRAPLSARSVSDDPRALRRRPVGHAVAWESSPHGETRFLQDSELPSNSQVSMSRPRESAPRAGRGL